MDERKEFVRRPVTLHSVHVEANPLNIGIGWVIA